MKEDIINNIFDINDDNSDNDSSNDSDNDNDNKLKYQKSTNDSRFSFPAADEDDASEGNDEDGNFTFNSENNEAVKPITAEDLKKFSSKINKTGVVYISRVPPFMKPIKVRQLLSRFGEIGKIYLVPEDAKVTARRKKYKGNKRINYTEGWVEFIDKNIAKSVADLLNGKIIGGKKRSFYHDDLWTLKYLPRFKWDHLTEQIAYERAVSESKLKAEMSQARKEIQAYTKNVEKGKMIENIQEKKRNRADGNAESVDDTFVRRKFKQRKTVDEKKILGSDLFE